MDKDTRTTKLRLYPEHRALAGEEGIYGDLEFPPPDSHKLPYVLMNMVSSVDGRPSVGGRAAGIGSRTDREAMRALRSRVDAVMVGAGTLRAEKLNLGLDDPGDEQPLAVVVAGAGGLPIRERLVVGRQRVIVAAPEGSRRIAEEGHEAGEVSVRVIETPGSGGGRADLRWLLGVLKSEYGVDRLLVEGGPTLNRSLIDEGLVHELFLTIAPKLLLGPEASILSAGQNNEPCGSGPRDLTLIAAHSAADEIFLRYRFQQPGRRP
ncbi:MAG TPA: RibD family protein [Rubrobacter sp.]|nr:RibD family protein [Rubrobacter sp.]